MGGVGRQFTPRQLARKRFGVAARLVGFGTDRRTVAAASDWDGHNEESSGAARDTAAQARPHRVAP